MLQTVRSLKKRLTLGQILGLIAASLVLLGLGFSLLLIQQQQDIRQQASTLARCTEDARVCPDGTVVGRDSQNSCQFFPCPLPAASGTTVTTNPDNIGGRSGSAYSTGLGSRCPTDNQGAIICPQVDPVICDQGQTWIADTNPDLCGCYGGGSCVTDGSGTDGNLIACTEDAKICPDGSYVGRDAANGCQFFPCPSVSPTPSPTVTPTASPDSCPRDDQGDIVCPQSDVIICDQGETAVYNTIPDSCGCVLGGACVKSDIAGSCSFQQVQCVTTPCDPVLVCPSPSPTATPSVSASPTTSPTTSPTPTPNTNDTNADLNGDQRIDLNDYVILVKNFFKSGADLAGDINNDGQVNLLDFVILRRQFSLF